MNYLKKLLSIFVAGVLLYGCQKEYSVETGIGNHSSSQWQFTESSTLFKGPIDTAYVDTVSSIKFLTLQGKSDDGKDIISLQVYSSDLKAAAYKSPFCSFTYQRLSTTLYQSDLTAIDSFSISISQIDAFGVSGTFSGKVKDQTGASKTITGGKFTGKFKNNSTTKDSGQVMLWSKAGCGGTTNPIDLSVSGRVGQITSFYPAEPAACGVAGTLTIKLPVGTYNWKAKCGVDSVTGAVIVTANNCTKVEVNFSAPQGDYFPTTPNSNWTLHYQGGATSDTTYTVSTGQTISFGGNNYNIFHYQDFYQNYLDTFYYRKGAGLYYQYFSASTNVLRFDNPTAVEYIFLEDNVPVNSSWEKTISGTIQGTPITGAKIQGKILEKATSLSVGGVTFLDVIRVQITFFYVAGGLSQEAGHVEQWYARNKGQIKRFDYVTAPFTQPADVLDIMRWQVY